MARLSNSSVQAQEGNEAPTPSPSSEPERTQATALVQAQKPEQALLSAPHKEPD